MILADKIIELRKKNGLSQEELAEKLNVSRQSISKWEGAQSIPDMNKILKLSDLFSVSTDYLLKDEIEEMETQVPIEDHDSSVREASVSMEEANAYLAYKSRIATPMAFAVLLFIVSAAPLIALQARKPGERYRRHSPAFHHRYRDCPLPEEQYGRRAFRLFEKGATEYRLWGKRDDCGKKGKTAKLLYDPDHFGGSCLHPVRNPSLLQYDFLP